MLQVAVPPLTGAAPQPEIVVPLAVNATVPASTVVPGFVVSATVAVSVMLLAVDAGLLVLLETLVEVESTVPPLKVIVSDQLEIETGSGSSPPSSMMESVQVPSGLDPPKRPFRVAFEPPRATPSV